MTDIVLYGLKSFNMFMSTSEPSGKPFQDFILDTDKRIAGIIRDLRLFISDGADLRKDLTDEEISIIL